MFNAATVLLTASTSIDGGSTLDVSFIIGDVADQFFDSAVFLDNFRFTGDEVSGSSTVPSSLHIDHSMRDARS